MTSDEMNLAAQFYLRNFTVVIVGDSSIINKAQYLPQQAPAPAGEELEGGSSGTGAAAHHE
jgi:hypothetical protein